MKEVLEITFCGWTATPRLPFVLSGNAVCMKVPSYSIALGIIGCCMGRLVTADEVNMAIYYEYDSESEDIETRQRLEFDGVQIKPNSKGSDAHKREFHSNPKLVLWIDRLDWEEYFRSPKGTPALGRSQDLLWIDSVRRVNLTPVDTGKVSGCMLPFNPEVLISGQLVQLAESFRELDTLGAGRVAINSQIYIAVPFDTPGRVTIPDLYLTEDEQCIYWHQFALQHELE